MGKFVRIPGLILLAALALSCEKHKGDQVFDSQLIVLDAAPGAGGSTKGFLNRGDLTHDGTRFQTYDYLSGYNGTISGHTNGEEFQYFANTLTYNGAATTWKWVFGDTAAPTTYRWTKTGTHHFFGWLLADGNDATHLATSSFFDSYSVGTKSVTLTKDLDIDDYQYDFLYSDVVPVDVINDGIPSKVDLPMKHLFGALGVSVKNQSQVDVVVYSITFKNFPNKKTVTLNYGDLANGVTISSSDASAPDPYYNNNNYWPNKLPNAGITLYNVNHATLANKVYDAYTGTEVTEQNPVTYRMCWPVSLAALEPTVTGLDAQNNPIYSSGSPLISVRCKVGNESARTLDFRFPKLDGAVDAISAGKRTHLSLQFANKQVLLSYDILPWQYEEFPMAFEGDAISSTQLKFVDGTYTDGGKVTENGVKHVVVQLKEGSDAGYYVAKGTFKIYTPVNATLSVAMSGNTEDFIVSLDSGTTNTGNGTESITIDPQRDGGLITLTIRPRGTAASGKKVYLHFAVRNGGRDSDADTEINRDNYKIVIP